TSSPNPSTFGQSVTFTATVASGSGIPTGTVTFTEGATTLASNVAVNGSGQATFSTTTLAVGSHTITASFTGASGWQNSSGNDSATPQVVQSGSSNPITLLQAKAVQGSGVPSVSAAFSSGNTAGNLILAFVRMSTTSQTVTLNDSAGNTYIQAVAQLQNSDGSQVHLFYARNIVGGANTVTATFSSTNNHPWLTIYEYSGLNAANPLDQTASAQGGGAAASSGATATTTGANELVFAATGLPASYSGTVTAGSGYTMQASDLTGSTGANEAEIVTSTGSFTGTFNLSSSVPWSAIVATFKQ
ncbi:MAG TPA: Ig-like domain repeat protein, partial [Blastocatellia bacterium]|nr:Ig-like domain repeat protein [Blastocatellia bacterium]